jgi:formylglycine-generating enzyme required for sulfatase activity
MTAHPHPGHEHPHACCAPGSAPRTPGAARTGPGPATPVAVAPDRTAAPAPGTGPDLVALPGGEFVMGHDGQDGYPEDGEGPAHRVRLAPFRIDATAVTNARFTAFVAATGHVTQAERDGWSFVFAGLLPDDFPPTRGVVGAPWWRQVEGADWRHPRGPRSDLDGIADHPVVHVTWDDAARFAAWAGGRLPTEAEWEYAARGGLTGVHYPWGAEREPGGRHRMNVWQGDFPAHDTAEDSYAGTAPVDAYPPNGFGLSGTTGNVWEWCGDWFAADTYRAGPRTDPRGPASGDRRVLRGGSYLCHASYCFRYRVDSRSSSTPDSAAGNVGFRCAADA